MKKLLPTFKAIIYLPVLLILVWCVDFGFGWLIGLAFKAYLSMGTIAFVICMLLFWGFMWGTFRMMVLLFAYLSTYFAPNRFFAAISISAIAVLNAIYLIYQTWSIPMEFSAAQIVICAGFTYLVLNLTWYLIGGALILGGD